MGGEKEGETSKQVNGWTGKEGTGLSPRRRGGGVKKMDTCLRRYDNTGYAGMAKGVSATGVC